MLGKGIDSSTTFEEKITIYFSDGRYNINIPDKFLSLPEEERAYLVTRLATTLGVKEIIKIF